MSLNKETKPNLSLSDLYFHILKMNIIILFCVMLQANYKILLNIISIE